MKILKRAAASGEEIILEGIAASPGIVCGRCYLHREKVWVAEPHIIAADDIAEEIQRFRKAVQKAHDHLQTAAVKAREQFGEDLAELLEMQMALLDDQVFLHEVEEAIARKRFDCAYATFEIFHQKKELFLQMSNEYFRDRAGDVQNLRQLLIHYIQDDEHGPEITLQEPAIVVANNLSPANTIQLHDQKALGFTTRTGGKNSHTAIVARSLGVPAVVGTRQVTSLAHTGDMMILDGNLGRVILNPSKKTLAAYQKKRRAYQQKEAELLQESSRETRTQDGHRIHLHSNIEFEEELPRILKVGADGIGLFRTEGLFINRSELPTEDEQMQIYRHIADSMYPRKVVIRTLDIGGDKMFPDIVQLKEENPFLGWRAIRFWLDHSLGFLTQLKAILRANLQGNIQILLPMVSGLGEILKVKALLEQAKEDLRKQNVEFSEQIEMGIMVEIPSVAVLADVLAREVDFFSIGTNDLVQYTLAVDRGNPKVAKLYSYFHPAVLRMIKMTIDAGRRANIMVAMCGEMAADPQATPLLIAMGLTHFSAGHSAIPQIKKIIGHLRMEECQALYQKIEPMTLTAQIVETVEQFFRQKFPGLATQLLTAPD